MLSAPLQLSCPCNYAFLCLTPLTFLTVILNCFLPHLSERSRSKCVQLPGSPIAYTLFGFPFTPLVYKTPTHSLVFRFNRFHLLRATLAPRERNERASEHRIFDSGREGTLLVHGQFVGSAVNAGAPTAWIRRTPISPRDPARGRFSRGLGGKLTYVGLFAPT